MKHAGAGALDRLEPLLAEIRALPRLKEKKRGLFYLKGRSLLHFHEDPKGLFADLAWQGTDRRFRVSTAEEQARLLDEVREMLAQAG